MPRYVLKRRDSAPADLEAIAAAFTVIDKVGDVALLVDASESHLEAMRPRLDGWTIAALSEQPLPSADASAPTPDREPDNA
ncbi:hypothetical protein [Caulobacter sp. X]|uniref:hypothetical protein n=1 Tax=Caulobacter sp. X TaxID=2048901 RepID=UPI000C157E72|nr:hypothetical protein [Caulobacter sp. X]PIC02118.1 hypothetical protein CSW60_11785 [Caulobacter sp. X]